MNSLHTPRQQSAGFTLVELMVTLAVAAILAAIALPNLRDYVLNVRRDSVIDSLVSSLHYARSQALTLDQNAYLCAGNATPVGGACPGGTWANGWEVVTLPANSSTVNLLTTNALPIADSVPTLKALDGNLFIEFTPLGLLAVNGPTKMATPKEMFVVCDARGGTYARAVEVNATGYIQSSPTPGFEPDATTALGCP